MAETDREEAQKLWRHLDVRQKNPRQLRGQNKETEAQEMVELQQTIEKLDADQQ
jgi:hypothetical protein